MNTQQGAREILAHTEAIYAPAHDYVSVREEDYAHLDLGFYRDRRTELESQGFVHLDDCEDRIGVGRTIALLGAYAFLCLVAAPALAFFLVTFLPAPAN